MTATAPETLAAIHHRCFTDAPRPWSAAEFSALLELVSTILVATPEGFALGRVAGPEAELMTLAVLPEARRRGLGRSLLAAFAHAASARGVKEIHLEVAENNDAARALYAEAGYAPAGFRNDYYGQDGHRKISALVLRKNLHSDAEEED